MTFGHFFSKKGKYLLFYTGPQQNRNKGKRNKNAVNSQQRPGSAIRKNAGSGSTWHSGPHISDRKDRDRTFQKVSSKGKIQNKAHGW
jgi:hypothetical protein